MAETKIYKRSLIQKYFNKEDYIELYQIMLTHGVDNNGKYLMIQDYMKSRNIPFTPLGCGTNRCAVLVDGFVIKFGLDSDGID